MTRAILYALVGIVIAALVALVVRSASSQELAPLQLFAHPPPGTLDPYSGYLCACHGQDCNPIPTNWDTGMGQLVPGGPWVDLYSLQTDRVYDVTQLPGEYGRHASICRTVDKTRITCLFLMWGAV